MSESENVKRTLNQAAGIAKECKASTTLMYMFLFGCITAVTMATDILNCQ